LKSCISAVCPFLCTRSFLLYVPLRYPCFVHVLYLFPSRYDFSPVIITGSCMQLDLILASIFSVNIYPSFSSAGRTSSAFLTLPSFTDSACISLATFTPSPILMILPSSLYSLLLHFYAFLFFLVSASFFVLSALVLVPSVIVSPMSRPVHNQLVVLYFVHDKCSYSIPTTLGIFFKPFIQGILEWLNTILSTSLSRWLSEFFLHNSNGSKVFHDLLYTITHRNSPPSSDWNISGITALLICNLVLILQTDNI